jgi:hypothetical protein
VVCHNRLIGFGDAIKMEQDGARAVDFYGNLTLSAYDNAIELDGSAGNTRALANMLVNSYSPLSFQPILGGPAYALRNVVVNVADEQHKLHSNLNTGETVGAVIVHNTFVSPRHAINLQAAATAHAFALVNNLYVGPAAPEDGKVVDWSVPIDAGVIDNNGYYPGRSLRLRRGRARLAELRGDAGGRGVRGERGAADGGDVCQRVDGAGGLQDGGGGARRDAGRRARRRSTRRCRGRGSTVRSSGGAGPRGARARLRGADPRAAAEGVDEATPAAGCGEEGGRRAVRPATAIRPTRAAMSRAGRTAG